MANLLLGCSRWLPMGVSPEDGAWGGVGASAGAPLGPASALPHRAGASGPPASAVLSARSEDGFRALASRRTLWLMRTEAVSEAPLPRRGSGHPGWCPSPARTRCAFRPAHTLCSVGVVGAAWGSWSCPHGRCAVTCSQVACTSHPGSLFHQEKFLERILHDRKLSTLRIWDACCKIVLQHICARWCSYQHRKGHPLPHTSANTENQSSLFLPTS